jgi:hypothetical protein
MPGGSRSLPGRPNLRHLKLEAKRRAAAGEFPTLHEAQVAIAREHGLPTWGALKQRVSTEQESYARTRRSTRRPTRARAACSPALGWIITPRGDVATHAGANLDATAAVTSRISDQRTHVVLTSRLIPINTIEVRLLRAWTNPAQETGESHVRAVPSRHPDAATR